jgi:diadenylate cyclase
VVIRFIQGTRAAGALKGTLFIIVLATIVVRVLGQQEAFQRIKFLYDTFLTLLAITLIVVFQPELRRGLIRLGETPILRRTHRGTSEVIDALVESAAYLSKASFGALIVVERENRLKGLVEGGTPIHGQVSARLLETIFFPGSALHDLAVVVRGGEVISAGVQLPLAEPEDMPDPSLGSRHRAALGLSMECDALVVVVSDETGTISLAERGRFVRGLTPDELRDALWRRLRSVPGRPVAEEAPATTSLSGDSSVVGMNVVNSDSLAGAPSISEPSDESSPKASLRLADAPSKTQPARTAVKRSKRGGGGRG